jgi:hypothetical protein
MATRSTRKPPQNPFLTTTTPDELPPAQRLAYDIVAERRDLVPSMGVPGDANRDPRVASAAFGGATTAESPTAT